MADATADGSGPRLDVSVPPDMTHEPTQMGCQAIDFLFVIDSSESMKDHQAELIASFPGFAEAIAGAVPDDDWHVMVVDTDGQWGGAECANACATLGSCPDEPGFDCSTPPPELCDITIGAGEVAPFGEGASNEVCVDGDARYVAEATDDLPGVFACVAQVGVDGNSAERQGDALSRALGEGMVAEDGCNAGFLRDDAILVVTVITDEPDVESETEPGDWVQAMLDAKSGDPEAIVALGLLPEEGAPRLIEMLDALPNGSHASVLEPDYTPFFAAAVDVILEVCEDFEPPIPEG
jgi:hypothetical protein